jgi:AcrR family transcriptional regulator
MPPPSYRDYRLPRGNHGLSRAQVAENQRWRLLGAASELLAERRLAGLTSRLIARRAGVSSHTFYEHFDNVDGVLAAAFANAAQLLVELIAGDCASTAEHREQVYGALEVAISLGAMEPGLVALFRVEVAVGIPEVGAERERLLARLDALAAARGTETHRRSAIAGAFSIAVEWLGGNAPGTTDSIAGELTPLLD